MTEAVKTHRWRVYVGESLTSRYEDPIEIYLTPEIIEELRDNNEETWKGVLDVIHDDLKLREDS